VKSHATLRLKLLIAYDGRSFRGWQSQAGGDTVQDRLEQAFMRVCGHRIVVHGSGRTDAGVHALGQVAHVDVPRDFIPPAKWQAALHANLPHEIRVLKVSRAAADFHARFDASGKTYVYRIWNGPFLHPMEIGRAWHVPGALDLAILRACIRKLTGTHDFAGFAANRTSGSPSDDTIRTIREIHLARRGALLTLRFTGDGFLYKMVRLITGTLIRCALHRAKPPFIDELLAGKGNLKTHFQAPAEGLYLTRVFY
jgi:tRNA pseudouridine38-40 synthase